MDFVPIGNTKLPEGLVDGEKVSTNMNVLITQLTSGLQCQFTLKYDIHLAADSKSDAPVFEAPVGGEPMTNGR